MKTILQNLDGIVLYIYIYIKRTNLGQNADSRFAALKQDTTN